MKKLTLVFVSIILVFVVGQTFLLINISLKTAETKAMNAKIVTQDTPCFTLQNADGWYSNSPNDNPSYLINNKFNATIRARFYPIKKLIMANNDYTRFLVDAGEIPKTEIANFDTAPYPNIGDGYGFPYFSISKTVKAADPREVIGSYDMAIVAEEYRDFVGVYTLLTDGKTIPDTNLINQLNYVAANFVPGCGKQ